MWWNLLDWNIQPFQGPEKPHSCLFPKIICSDSLWTKERLQRTQFLILGGYWSFLLRSSHMTKHFPKLSALTILGHNPNLWWRLFMIHHLEPIKSPCFPLGDWLLWPPSLEPENVPCSCFAQISLLLFVFNSAWSGFLLGWRNLLPYYQEEAKGTENLLELSFPRWLRSNLTILSEWLIWKELLHKQQQEQNNWGPCSKEKMEKRSYSSPSNSRDAAACLFISKGLTTWVVKHLWKSLKGLSITM